MFVFLFAHQTHMTYYSSTTHSKVKILKEIKIFYKYYHRLIHVSGLISPGQGALLQLFVSERSWVEQPWSQVLVLVCSPNPHGALQLDQLLHVEKSKRLVNKDHRLWAIVIDQTSIQLWTLPWPVHSPRVWQVQSFGCESFGCELFGCDDETAATGSNRILHSIVCFWPVLDDVSALNQNVLNEKPMSAPNLVWTTFNLFWNSFV